MSYGEGLHGGSEHAELCPHGKLPGICAECLKTEEGLKKQAEIIEVTKNIGSEIAQKLEQETGIKPYDVLMVLGCDFREPLHNKQVDKENKPVPEDQSGWLLGQESRMRLMAAAQLYLEGRVRMICLTGGPAISEKWKNYPSLAKLGKKYLVERWGIPEKDIFDEHESDATHNNFALGLRQMYEHNIPAGNFAVVSTNYHLNRAREMAKMMGIKADLLPAESQLLKINPHFSRFVSNWLDKAQNAGREEAEVVKLRDEKYWQDRAALFQAPLDQEAPHVDISQIVAQTAEILTAHGNEKAAEGF